MYDYDYYYDYRAMIMQLNHIIILQQISISFSNSSSDIYTAPVFSENLISYRKKGFHRSARGQNLTCTSTGYCNY